MVTEMVVVVGFGIFLPFERASNGLINWRCWRLVQSRWIARGNNDHSKSKEKGRATSHQSRC